MSSDVSWLPFGLVKMSPTDENIEDEIDAALLESMKNRRRVPSIEALNSEMPSREYQRDKGKKIIRNLLNKLRLRRSASATISKPDPTYKVAYLGNVVTGWAKGELITYSFLFL